MPNEHINKVEIYRNSSTQTLIDITDTTATASDVAQGKYFYLASGERVAGTSSGGSGDGYILTTIVPQTTFTPNSSRIYSLSSVATGRLYDGESYLVTLDGTQYLTTCGIEWSTNYIIGEDNIFFSTNDHVYPFAIGWVSAQEFEICVLDAQQHTVKVEHIELVSPTVLTTKTITTNGTYNASGDNATGYSSVTVNVSGGGGGGGITQDQDGYLVLSPDGGGGSVTVEPLSVTQNGTYTASSGTAYSPVTVNVSGGGGGDMNDPIRFFDYDGTLVASYSSVPSSLPSVPTHTGLTNGAWNYTLAQVTAQFNAMGTCDVGANYETASGKTEIDCEFEYGRLSPYLRIGVNGTVAINWGDGSSAETVTGTSITTAVNKQHVYPSSGSYTITIEAQQGEYRLSGTNTYSLLHANSSTANYNLCYATCIRAVRIGADASVSSYAFYNCRKMKSVCIPSGVQLDQYAFGYCYELEAVVVPSGTNGNSLNQFVQNCFSLKAISFNGDLVSLPAYLCNGLYVDRISLPCTALVYLSANIIYNCYSVEHLKIRDGATSVPNSFGYGCTSLKSVSLPDSITQIEAVAFRNCYSLTSVTIPQAVTSIAANAFNGCQLGEIHFKPTTPPTFAANTVFGNLPTDCKIYVPTGTLSAYTSAANYPSSSTYTYIEE